MYDLLICPGLRSSWYLKKVSPWGVLSEGTSDNENNDRLSEEQEPVRTRETPTKKRKKAVESKMLDALEQAQKLMAYLSAEEEDADNAFAHYIKLRLKGIKINKQRKIKWEFKLKKFYYNT